MNEVKEITTYAPLVINAGVITVVTLVARRIWKEVDSVKTLIHDLANTISGLNLTLVQNFVSNEQCRRCIQSCNQIREERRQREDRDKATLWDKVDELRGNVNELTTSVAAIRQWVSDHRGGNDFLTNYHRNHPGADDISDDRGPNDPGRKRG